MKLTGENRNTRRKICPSATLSTTNLTWTDPGVLPSTLHHPAVSVRRFLLNNGGQYYKTINDPIKFTTSCHVFQVTVTNFQNGKISSPIPRSRETSYNWRSLKNVSSDFLLGHSKSDADYKKTHLVWQPTTLSTWQVKFVWCHFTNTRAYTMNTCVIKPYNAPTPWNRLV
jgi:hypothetical protein